MKFIWNFFFFGILFYLIWAFFPDAFNTLVGWANHIVAFFRDLLVGLWDRFQHQVPAAAPASSLLMLPFIKGGNRQPGLLRRFRK